MLRSLRNRAERARWTTSWSMYMYHPVFAGCVFRQNVTPITAKTKAKAVKKKKEKSKKTVT